MILIAEPLEFGQGSFTELCLLVRIALAREDTASAEAYGIDRTFAVFIVRTSPLGHGVYTRFGTRGLKMDQLRGGDEQLMVVCVKVTALPAALTGDPFLVAGECLV